jgi:hypothetical protein
MQHQKPVRKCHGCPLNLGRHCWVFQYPRGQWRDDKDCRMRDDATVHGPISSGVNDQRSKTARHCVRKSTGASVQVWLARASLATGTGACCERYQPSARGIDRACRACAVDTVLASRRMKRPIPLPNLKGLRILPALWLGACHAAPSLSDPAVSGWGGEAAGNPVGLSPCRGQSDHHG